MSIRNLPPTPRVFDFSITHCDEYPSSEPADEPQSHSNVPLKYEIKALSSEYPVWPSDIGDGPLPIYCYQTGDLLLCPLHLTKHRPAHAIGVDDEAAGIICNDCNTIYATRRFLAPECFDDHSSKETLYA